MNLNIKLLSSDHPSLMSEGQVNFSQAGLGHHTSVVITVCKQESVGLPALWGHMHRAAGHPALGPGTAPLAVTVQPSFPGLDICSGSCRTSVGSSLNLLILIWASHQVSAFCGGRVVSPSWSFLPCACFRASDYPMAVPNFCLLVSCADWSTHTTPWNPEWQVTG